MDHRSAPYPMSAIPDDEQHIDTVVQYPPIPETIELLNIPFRRTNEDADDDNLSFYLGREHVSLLSQNLIPFHRDMSLVSCNDCATIVMDTTRQNIFPVMLHSLLSDNARQHHQASFMWLPHGRAFVINDMAQFCSTIVPLIFSNTNIYTHRYEVFIGLLESYGFQQAVTRYGSPAFYHKVRNGVFGSHRPFLLLHFMILSFLSFANTNVKQRFLKFRWWLASTMELRRDDALTTPHSQAQAQYVFDCLPLLPTLQYDADLSYSAVVYRHFII